MKKSLFVFLDGKNCKTCDRVLHLLETLQTDLDDNGVRMAKSGDKKLAKSVAGVINFPALSYFKGEGDDKPDNFEGDLSDSEAVLDFLISPEALDLPDRIERVNAKQLEKLIEDKAWLAVLFHDAQAESVEALNRLEKIDTKADKLDIALVKISDLELVDEYALNKLPSLVYYRSKAPLLYEGDLNKQDAVFEWLLHNRATGDDEDVIEDVQGADALAAMIESIERLAVLFYDAEARKTDVLLEALEKIDDDCDAEGIHLVKISDSKAAAVHGLDKKLPGLVYFRDAETANVFEGE